MTATIYRVPPLEIRLTCASCDTDYFGHEIPDGWYDVLEEDYAPDEYDDEPRLLRTLPDGTEVWGNGYEDAPWWTHVGYCAVCYEELQRLTRKLFP